jgi:hypothetical protein
MEHGFRCADCDAVQEPKGTRSREHILMVGAYWFSIFSREFLHSENPVSSILGKTFCLISWCPVWKSRASRATPIPA